MKRLTIIIGIVVCSVLIHSCKPRELVRERAYTLVNNRSLAVNDSSRYQYQIEILREYNTNTGVLSRERITQNGDITNVVQMVRDTVYIEKVDTVYVAKGNSAPVDNSVIVSQKTKSKTTLFISVAVCVVILAVMFMVLYIRKEIDRWRL